MFTLKSVRRVLLSGFLAATALTATVALAQAKEKSAPAPKMWVIRDEDSTIYLYGSFHLLKADTRWKTPAFDKVFDSADTLYMEVDNLDDEKALLALMQQYGIDPAGGLLKPYTPQEQQRLREGFAKYGLDIDKLLMLKPWLAGVTLTIQQMKAAGFAGEAGVDSTLLAVARAKGLPVKGLETADTQVRLLSTGLFGDDARELLQLVDEEPRVKVLFETLLAAWRTGDEKALNRLLVTEMKNETPHIYKAIMVDRNRSWIAPIKAALAGSGTQIIVVGAGHLAGPDSVQALLRKEGIKVTAYDYQSAE
ncbi:MAG: TraB/GumN family protein [Asticcacaulis sp.]